MTIGVVGRKTGMTRVFTEEGVSVPVTVVQVEPNRVSQVKTVETDGYQAIQVTVGDRRAQHRVSQPIKGHLSKAEMRMGRGLWEFRVEDLGELAIGAEVSVSQFEAGQIVDVTGQSKGKGFAGAVKRWNFRTQDATHGNSLSHRAPGSIGNCQTPGRVFKGKKMAGHMGASRNTTQNIEVVAVDNDECVVLLCGSVPGPKNGWVLISDAIKAARPDDAPFPAGLLSDLAPASDDAPAEDVAAEESAVDSAPPDEADAEAPAAADAEAEKE